MSVEIQLLNKGQGLLYRYRGEVRYDDDRRANQDLDSKHDRGNVRFAIIDNLSATGNAVTNAELREAAEYCIALSQETNPQFIVAIVAPEDLSFGLGRMWQVLADNTGWSIGVFRDLAAASEWLLQEYRDVYGETLDEIVSSGVIVPEVGDVEA